MSLFSEKIVPLLFCILCVFSMHPGCTKVSVIQPAALGEMDTVRKALEKGARINEQDENGMTPLMHAARNNHFRVVEHLLVNHADPEITDLSGRTALDHAFEKDSFESFKRILEAGAAIHFDLNTSIYQGRYKKKLIALADEYKSVRKIQDASFPPKHLFQSYFQNHPNGHYLETVKNAFVAHLEKEFAKAGENGKKGLRAFIQSYSGFGSHTFRITASVLNIRQEPALDAPVIGQYQKKDIVYPVEIRPGWLKTENGWISRDYVQPVNTPGAYICASYLKKAEALLSDKPVHSVQTFNAASSHADSSREEVKDNSRREFEELIDDPTLSKLERFILKHKDDPEKRTQVRTARQMYKELLLGGDAP